MEESIPNSEKPLIRDLIVEGLRKLEHKEFSSILSSNNNDIKILINIRQFVDKVLVTPGLEPGPTIMGTALTNDCRPDRNSNIYKAFK